jgi:hypothetical protein
MGWVCRLSSSTTRRSLSCRASRWPPWVASPRDLWKRSSTNARLEGMNTKMRLLSHRAFGFHSPHPLIATIYLCRSAIELPELQVIWEDPNLTIARFRTIIAANVAWVGGAPASLAGACSFGTKSRRHFWQDSCVSAFPPGNR